MPRRRTIGGVGMVIKDNNVDIRGMGHIVTGNRCRIYAHGCIVRGSNNEIYGNGCIIVGDGNKQMNAPVGSRPVPAADKPVKRPHVEEIDDDSDCTPRKHTTETTAAAAAAAPAVVPLPQTPPTAIKPRKLCMPTAAASSGIIKR
jgi:hypothetical protein